MQDTELLRKIPNSGKLTRFMQMRADSGGLDDSSPHRPY